MRAEAMAAVFLVGGVLVASGCATKGYVREYVQGQVRPMDERLTQADSKLRETSTEVDASRRRIEGLDTKIGEVGSTAAQASAASGEASSLARDARKAADDNSAALHDVDSRLSGRLANRNRYSVLDTRSVYFDFGRSELNDGAMTALLEVAKALKEDVNAVVELQGHTDSVGSDRLNLELSRERVDAVARYLVRKEGIDLRRIHTLGFGKVAPVADNNTREGRAKNRRVDIRLLSPQS